MRQHQIQSFSQSNEMQNWHVCHMLICKLSLLSCHPGFIFVSFVPCDTMLNTSDLVFSSLFFNILFYWLLCKQMILSRKPFSTHLCRLFFSPQWCDIILRYKKKTKQLLSRTVVYQTPPSHRSVIKWWHFCFIFCSHQHACWKVEYDSWGSGEMDC